MKTTAIRMEKRGCFYTMIEFIVLNKIALKYINIFLEEELCNNKSIIHAILSCYNGDNLLRQATEN